MTRQVFREPVSLAVARALDERLHVTLEDHFALAESRLYGCCLMAPEHSIGCEPDWQVDRNLDRQPGTFRYSFLGAAASVYDLLDGSFAVLARAFDAACVVTSGWGAPLDADPECGHCPTSGCGHSCAARPSEHPERFRLVICTAVSDDGLSSVVRDSRRPEEPVEMCERGEGMLPDALELMWFGEVFDD